MEVVTANAAVQKYHQKPTVCQLNPAADTW